MFVDDDSGDRQLVRRTLEQAFSSTELTEVTDKVGLERALKGESPEVLLTDYALGWTSGLAVLLKAKKAWPDVPVIMVTGTGSEEIAVECMREGLDDYILKSSRHILRLPAAVKAALERVEERRALQETETRSRPVSSYGAKSRGSVFHAPSGMTSRGIEQVGSWCILRSGVAIREGGVRVGGRILRHVLAGQTSTRCCDGIHQTMEEITRLLNPEFCSVTAGGPGWKALPERLTTTVTERGG